MDKRIATRVVDTGGQATTTLVQKGAAEVYWITLSPETYGTKGSAKIYDGFDAGGKLQWQSEDAETHTHNFDPSIPCEQGIFVSVSAAIACFTIAYRARSWDREE